MTKPPVKMEIEEEDERLTVEALEPLFRPDKKDLGVQIVATMVRRVHSGPLPAPETYAQYEAVHAGAAERILKMAEKEQDHRHGSENKIIFHEYGIRYVAQFGAIFALILLCSLVAYCAFVGEPITAAVIGAVGAIVVAFLRYTQIKIDVEPVEKPLPTSKKLPVKRKR
ncbi:DUF2335 domain-containing protein [Sphingobium sp. Leaf26]|uniref:DUF2335 domain-containing protein n=1 Tax=Sphingobium sp. Leaf26 TaxID=1735693 RepID=UPI0012E2EE75|nr:DUF2335 domain-containing protein [Sphingobium sp. Leaf26]